MSDESRKIAQNINLVTAGNKTGDVLQAQCDAFVGTLCIATGSAAQAQELLDALVPDLKNEIAKHYDFYIAQLGESATSHSGGGKA